MKQVASKKGFTLVELLVVLAVVAVLTVIVVFLVNPSQVVKQSRDARRLSDLSTLQKALAVYIRDTSTLVLADANYDARCYVSTTSTAVAANCGGRHQGATTASPSPTAITGLGWLGSNGTTLGPDFQNLSSGQPIHSLPLDPVNDAAYFYSYAVDLPNSFYEINANMESGKYASGGSGDVESGDGGNNQNLYEIGNAPGFTL